MRRHAVVAAAAAAAAAVPRKRKQRDSSPDWDMVKPVKSRKLGASDVPGDNRPRLTSSVRHTSKVLKLTDEPSAVCPLTTTNKQRRRRRRRMKKNEEGGGEIGKCS